MAAQSVAGAARHKAKRGSGAGEDGGDLVHGAIAPGDHDERAVLLQGAGGQLRGMARVSRPDHGGALARRKFEEGGQRAGGGAGARVEDDAGFQWPDTF